ncbi:Acetoacetyl-CoA synthetase [Cyphellophora attinorum]|uniref:Acetoacetyl-CoA synthetase n=1 Tax=Cyphellophora attinorum TaxID=1664694 RepID=A0A0N1NXE1_9EURO|nr:Acetoacetyl-CoA synthetase [Phialophora attinorum]KPI38040.1 Acetoacetyl-CoA synthetase [Phialophora attinorum]
MQNGTTNGDVEEDVELWRHPNPESTEMYIFQQNIRKRHNVKGTTYQDLWQWSIDNPGLFWKEVWEYTGIKASKWPSSVFDSNSAMFPKPEFFPGCELNFAENLLYPASNPPADSVAVIEATEKTRAEITWQS